MARIEKAALAFLVLAQVAAAQEFRYQARHDHLRKSGAGTLVIGDKGVSFTENEGDHRWTWKWQDVQQLEIAPRTLRVLTYRDNRWRLGADREYRFDLDSGQSFDEAYEFLKDKLDQRLVAALADPEAGLRWSLPVKHMRRFGGTLGVLEVGAGRLVFRADGKGESRTWRFADIQNISRSGPFEFTLTSYEKAFNFQLREPLSEARYNQLWREIYEERKTIQ